MLWLMLIAILVLVGFAYDWVSLQVTAERVIMSVELARIAPVLKRIRQAIVDLFSRDRAFKEREHHT